MPNELDWNRGKTCMFMKISIISRDIKLRGRGKRNQEIIFKTIFLLMLRKCIPHIAMHII
jgi:hypothetical protein